METKPWNWKQLMISAILAALGALAGYTIQYGNYANEKKKLTEEILVLRGSNPQLYIRINGIRTSPQDAKIGGKLTIDYMVSNSSNMTSSGCWLGASITDSNGNTYYNASEDKIVHIAKGEQKYSRCLTIKDDWPSGRYKLAVQIWNGVVSDSRNSKLVDQYESEILVK